MTINVQSNFFDPCCVKEVGELVEEAVGEGEIHWTNLAKRLVERARGERRYIGATSHSSTAHDCKVFIFLQRFVFNSNKNLSVVKVKSKTRMTFVLHLW